MSAEEHSNIARRLRKLRREMGLTLRDVCEKARIAPSYLSNLERGGSSPTLATLYKILRALGTDLETFFSITSSAKMEGHVFDREGMRTAADPARRYTFLLPRRTDIKAEMLDEYLMPGEAEPEVEALECDIGAVVLTGLLELEVEGEDKKVLRAGDAFYVTAGTKHRGRCISSEPAHLITVYVPPKY